MMCSPRTSRTCRPAGTAPLSGIAQPTLGPAARAAAICPRSTFHANPLISPALTPQACLYGGMECIELVVVRCAVSLAMLSRPQDDQCWRVGDAHEPHGCVSFHKQPCSNTGRTCHRVLCSPRKDDRCGNAGMTRTHSAGPTCCRIPALTSVCAMRKAVAGSTCSCCTMVSIATVGAGCCTTFIRTARTNSARRVELRRSGCMEIRGVSVRRRDAMRNA